MGFGVSVTMTGLPEAIGALDQFGKGVRKTQTRNAVSAGAGVLRDASSRLANKESGLLKKNMRVRVIIPKNDSGIYAKIGAKRKVKVAVRVDAKSGATKLLTGKKLAAATAAGSAKVFRSPSRVIHLVEKGTKAHVVAAKNKRVLARAGTVFGTRVTVAAKPSFFLSRAARSSGSAATGKAIAKIREGVELERLKAARKGITRAVARGNRR